MLRVLGKQAIKPISVFGHVVKLHQSQIAAKVIASKMLVPSRFYFQEGYILTGQRRIIYTAAVLSKQNKYDDKAKVKNQTKETLPAIEAVPQVWPHLPVLVVDGDPVCPGFVRKFELTEPRLMDIIRRKVHLDQPFVGIFLKKDPSNKHQIIQSLDEIHKVGAFAQIKEIDDKMDHMSIAVVARRVIKIIGQVFDETIKPKKLSAADNDLKQKELEHLKMEQIEEPAKKEEKADETKETPKPAVLMVKVANMKSGPYEYSDEVRATANEVIKTIRQLFALYPKYVGIVKRAVYENKNLYVDLAALSYVCAFLSADERNELQAVMEEPEIPQRLLMALELSKKRILLLDLALKVRKDVDARIEEDTRKSMLRKEMKVIKRELGIVKDDNVAIREQFAKKLDGKILPAIVTATIEDEFERFDSLDTQHIEFYIVRNYLDWLTSLPWGVLSTENLNLRSVAATLDKDHYGMEEIKQRILEFVAVSSLKGSTHGKILCFYGPPGVGKTSIAKSIAKALNRKFCRFNVGGLADVAEIKGHRRTYAEAMPGRIIHCLRKAQTENPIILLDEIDKISKINRRRDPASALLELLDPEQNRSFLDRYLDVPVDLSRVLFICTANEINSISQPLRDRMELIELAGYIGEEKIAITRQYIIPTALRNAGLTEKDLTITDDAVQAIVKYYCNESGVRKLQEHIEKIIQKVAHKIVKKEAESYKIDEGNLTEYLGSHLFATSRLYNVAPPGVVMGLAWTNKGDAELYIETLTGKIAERPLDIIQTGNLGPVMKESARIALTVAKNFLVKIDESNDVLDTRQIHMHVPKCGLQKDGPSAGAAFTTALISLALDRPVKSNVAVCGEVSLTGKILKVHGIKEKVIVAKRLGITCLLLPLPNKEDFDELPDCIRKDMEAHFVDNFDEIMKSDKIYEIHNYMEHAELNGLRKSVAKKEKYSLRQRQKGRQTFSTKAKGQHQAANSTSHPLTSQRLAFSSASSSDLGLSANFTPLVNNNIINLQKPKSKAAPLSKYRRKTANARERTRMREINSAFENLRQCVPAAIAAEDVGATNEKLTKITTLRLAMKYISKLTEALQDPNFNIDFLNEAKGQCHEIVPDGGRGISNNTNNNYNSSRVSEKCANKKHTSATAAKNKSKNSNAKGNASKSKNTRLAGKKRSPRKRQAAESAAEEPKPNDFCENETLLSSSISLNSFESDSDSLNISDYCLSPLQDSTSLLGSYSKTQACLPLSESCSESDHLNAIENPLELNLLLLESAALDYSSDQQSSAYISPLTNLDPFNPFGDLMQNELSDHSPLDLFLT